MHHYKGNSSKLAATFASSLIPPEKRQTLTIPVSIGSMYDILPTCCLSFEVKFKVNIPVIYGSTQKMCKTRHGSQLKKILIPQPQKYKKESPPHLAAKY